MKFSYLVMKVFVNEYCYFVRVKMFGVWDMVGVLGVFDLVFKSNIWYGLVLNLFSFIFLFRKNYMFYDQNFLCIVDEVYYVLVIDEYCEDFVLMFWDVMREENKVLE